jgi:hypothetical protein
MATDEGVHERIKVLLEREKELRQALADGTVDRADEQAQILALEAELDQAWDLLRQREALRDSGRSPAEAKERPIGEVESYLQ